MGEGGAGEVRRAERRRGLGPAGVRVLFFSQRFFFFLARCGFFLRDDRWVPRDSGSEGLQNC